jgi:hypothetical protein
LERKYYFTHCYFQGITEARRFTDADILLVEQRINFFTPKWLKLTGREGLPNYNHLLIGGHIVEYMERWRSLYQFSNQGWEQQNASINYLYNHRTPSGRFFGKKGGRSSKFKPIGLWLLHLLYWETKDESQNNIVTITGAVLV